MSLITLADLQNYTNVIAENEGIQQQYIDAAEKIVVSYLGYNPAAAEYTEKYNGNGTQKLSLLKKNITAVSSIKIDGVLIDAANFVLPTKEDEEIIYCSTGVFTKGYKNIYVVFSAGWETVPADIKMVALEIAALIQTTGNGNIGITSKSFEASGTRTFIQNRNYDDYLVKISKYKIIG